MGVGDQVLDVLKELKAEIQALKTQIEQLVKRVSEEEDF